MNIEKSSFRQFLAGAFTNGQYATDDVIAFVLPLFDEVISFHEAGLVAPFGTEQALFITGSRLDIDEGKAHPPSIAAERLQSFFASFRSRHFDIVGRSKLETEVDAGVSKVEEQLLHLTNDALQYPAFLPGYECFEIRLGHHDAQTDIFCLGLILGGMALGLNLYDHDDLETFARFRTNPAQFNPRIHPTLSTLINEMTELDRLKRIPDLYDVVHRLRHYRDYDPDKQADLSQVAGWIDKDRSDRHHLILNKLRNRLFDTSRRNRLLYYKPNMRFVNLTVSSVPMVLHYQSIRPELLFTWNADVSSRVVGMKEIVLNKYLRFEDHSYLGAALDKIRVESQRDIQEYGFSQLKLVISFLNWHNLKEDAKERIQSPLLLIPVELKKVKRITEDHYHLRVLDNAAEVNPILANQLRDLYGIRLPDFVDLDEMDLAQFCQLLRSQIDAANQGIRLHFIEKPRIRLVHSIARQTVVNYRKRMRRSGRQLDSYRNIPYSYQMEQYRPLGLEIFRQRIEPRATFLEFLVNDDISLSTHQLTGDDVKERELYEITESESNPYSWDFDVCNIVLGNFNYKKMSLVRDYNQVMDQNVEHKVFESLFSPLPRSLQTDTANLDNPGDWHHVITADPTQTRAVLKSRSGESYIIQGPPGTGKSQTITNLIADFVARGKSILFVCEKRAALDVVFHRLKQNGLDELCCYIHGSQSDKREFVRNLKVTYEDFIQNRLNLQGVKQVRQSILEKIQEQLGLLQEFHSVNGGTTDEAGMPVRQLIDRIISLREQVVSLQPAEQELMPPYRDWIQYGETIALLGDALEASGADAAFANHPLSKLNDSIFTDDQPLHLAGSLVEKSRKLLSIVLNTIHECNIPEEHCEYLGQIKSFVQDAVLLFPLAEHNNLTLAIPGNPLADEFDKKVRQYKQCKLDLAAITDVNVHWKNKFSEQDVDAAIPIAEKNERSFLAFFSGSWKKLKGQIRDSYDFDAHQVKPAYSAVLKQLKGEFTAAAAVKQYKEQLQLEYRLDNIDTTYLGLELLRTKRGDKEIDYLLAHPHANAVVTRLYRLNDTFHELEQQLSRCLQDVDGKPIMTIQDELETAAMNLDNMYDLLPALKDFTRLPEPVKRAIRRIPMTPTEVEATIAHGTLQSLLQKQRSFAHIDALAIEKAVQQLSRGYRQLLKLNAELVRASIRSRFIAHIELCNTAVSQLNAEQRQFKKTYNEGRKILENEFGKSMRYKSIRELSAKESGLVLRDIKPVWLMSPLSVSDSLPVDVNYFDVVIFDEASQITLEEGIPALYRSNQTIIVGDDRQMPPTNFFSAKAEDPDDIAVPDEPEDGELLTSDADSLLVQGARKLNSTMLSWHYRSHYETLISYSNHAFYDAALLTIPDRTIHHEEKRVIEVNLPTDASGYADCLYDRSISFHYLTNSIYEKRSNEMEAQYIAAIVRELLKKKVKESIGIVAFSQEQQTTIEDALTSLAGTDKEFNQLLEAAYERTDDEQFTGLIIKNLENIQGDERDIIIMSICYGFDAKRKMLMNFGPINRKGGERRLNVIFSRAKKHMAVVSSIKYHNITNEYNEGANYLRRFLQYAESVSTGDMRTAGLILEGLVVHRTGNAPVHKATSVTMELKRELEKLGYEVAEQVGQSGFKCSLAVRVRPGDSDYTLSILIDDDNHYANGNILEQYYQRPAVLQSFGWRTIQVFGKDWLHNPGKVVEQVVRRIREHKVTEDTIDIALPEIPFAAVAAQPDRAAPATVQTQAVIPGLEDISFDRYVFTDATSNKFWEAGTKETKLIVRFGRIGTKGQVQVKTYPDTATAQREKEKAIREKINKGYKADQ